MTYLAELGSMPFLVVEAQERDAHQGIFQAEYQCATSAVKLLFKLRLLGISEPVVCMTLVGDRVFMYLASWRDTECGPEYCMQEAWNGLLNTARSCATFHVILYRLFEWAKGDLRKRIIDSFGNEPTTH